MAVIKLKQIFLAYMKHLPLK